MKELDRVRAEMTLIQNRIVQLESISARTESEAREIHHAFAPGITDTRVPDVPLPGNRPIEHFGAGGDFPHCQRNMAADVTQGLTQPVSGNAAA